MRVDQLMNAIEEIDDRYIKKVPTASEENAISPGV